MSIERCDKHNWHWDTDYKEQCPLCYAAEQARADQRKYPACKSTNCGCTDGISHSPERIAEHDALYNEPSAGVTSGIARSQDCTEDASRPPRSAGPEIDRAIRLLKDLDEQFAGERLNVPLLFAVARQIPQVLSDLQTDAATQGVPDVKSANGAQEAQTVANPALAAVPRDHQKLPTHPLYVANDQLRKANAELDDQLKAVQERLAEARNFAVAMEHSEAGLRADLEDAQEQLEAERTAREGAEAHSDATKIYAGAARQRAEAAEQRERESGIREREWFDKAKAAEPESTRIKEQIAAVRQETIEECAKVCKDKEDALSHGSGFGYTCSNAIRALGRK